MLDFVQILWMHLGKKWLIIKVFVIWKLLILFLRILPKSSMDAENLRFDQIMGAKQAIIMYTSLGTYMLFSQQKADG